MVVFPTSSHQCTIIPGFITVKEGFIYITRAVTSPKINSVCKGKLNLQNDMYAKCTGSVCLFALHQNAKN